MNNDGKCCGKKWRQVRGVGRSGLGERVGVLLQVRPEQTQQVWPRIGSSKQKVPHKVHFLPLFCAPKFSLLRV